MGETTNGTKTTTMTTATAAPAGPGRRDGSRYRAPGWFTRHVFNRAVAGLTRLGVSIRGSRVLRVRGRVSGEWRANPVNLLRHRGGEYLVAPRGRTQWVQNLRAAGTGELRVGRRVETFDAHEIADADKVDVLRDYLRHWKWEVGQFFDGVGPDAADDELAAIAPGYPVFRIERRAAPVT
jgi:deazaflavin-dependent oxidoreductase (nitroreductase family)